MSKIDLAHGESALLTICSGFQLSKINLGHKIDLTTTDQYTGLIWSNSKWVRSILLLLSTIPKAF